MDSPQDIFFVKDQEPGYKYYWANRADRNMIQMLGMGWEVVRGAPEVPRDVIPGLSKVTGQSSDTPVSDEVRTRGDLILVRMPEALFNERVRRPVELARARQRSSVDTLVEQANEQTRAQLARARQQNIRPRHVFSTTDDTKFESEGVKT